MTLARYVPILASIALTVPLILGSYARAAARARKVFVSERALRRSNRGTGAVIAGTAGSEIDA